LTITLLADTHGLHRELMLPPGDLLVCAGDLSSMDQSRKALLDFNSWLGEQKKEQGYRNVVVVYGNHERSLEPEHMRSILTHATVLLNEGIDIGGLRIWGSPVTPNQGDPFGMVAPEDRTLHWSKIPDDTDLLVTHGPPWGIRDQPPGERRHLGDPELLSAIGRLRNLRLHAFGHVHGAYGLTVRRGVSFANVALLGEGGGIEQVPMQLRMPRLDE
jgi:Icc-related predicted phosphoesterase